MMKDIDPNLLIAILDPKGLLVWHKAKIKGIYLAFAVLKKYLF